MSTLFERVWRRATEQFSAQGYVRWPLIAEQEGQARQRILYVLQKGVAQDRISAAQLALWRGSHALCRTLSFKCEPTNREWLEELALQAGIPIDDVLNRLIVQHRKQSTLQSHDFNPSQQEP